MLPELCPTPIEQPALTGEYSSANVTLSRADLRELLAPYLNEQQQDILL